MPGQLTAPTVDRCSVAVPAPVEPARASVPRGPAPAKAAPARRAGARRGGRRGRWPTRCGRQLAEARQGRHLEPDGTDQPRCAARARAGGDRLDADGARPGGEGGAGARGRSRFGRPRPRGRRCARAGSTAAAAAPGRVAFLYTGRGFAVRRTCWPSCARREPVVAELFEEADAIMAPLLEGRRVAIRHRVRRPSGPGRRWRGRRRSCAARRSQQPAVLTVDTALTRLLGERGICTGSWSWATRWGSTGRSREGRRALVRGGATRR